MKIILIILSLIFSIAISRKIQTIKVVEVNEAKLSQIDIKRYTTNEKIRAKHISDLFTSIEQEISNNVEDDFLIKINLNKQNTIQRRNYINVCIDILKMISQLQKHKKEESHRVLYKIYFVNNEEKYKKDILDSSLVKKTGKQNDPKINLKEIDGDCYYKDEDDINMIPKE